MRTERNRARSGPGGRQRARGGPEAPRGGGRHRRRGRRSDRPAPLFSPPSPRHPRSLARRTAGASRTSQGDWEGDPEIRRQLDAEIGECVTAKVKEESRDAYKRAWRYWVVFVVLIAGLGHDAVFRVYDGLPDRRQRLNDELSVMRFACWLRQRGMATSTVASTVSMFRTMHRLYASMDICEGFKMHRLSAQLKGMGELFPCTPRDRFPITVPMFAVWTSQFGWYGADNVTYAASVELMFQGLLRAAECVPRALARWDPRRYLTWGHLRFVMQDEHTPAYAEVRITPCKQANKGPGRHASRLPLVLPYEADAPVNACRALWHVRQVAIERGRPMGADAPVLTEPSSARPIVYPDLLRYLRMLLSRLGSAVGRATQYALHSLRIGGATALLKAGCPPSVIQALGRWSSEIFRLYTRACFGDAIEWAKKMSRAEVSPLEIEALLKANDISTTGKSSALASEQQQWHDGADSDSDDEPGPGRGG